MKSGDSVSVKLGTMYEEIKNSRKKTSYDIHSHPLDYKKNC